MIFVAVGTQKFPFDRLIEKIDTYVQAGIISEPVFIQRGHSNYVPVYAESACFLTKDEFQKQMESCRLLISHGGVSTIVSALKLDKPVIVVPRLKEYGEHVDDHQLQIVKSFSEKNYIMQCSDVEKLADLVEQVESYPFEKYISRRDAMVETVLNFLDSVSKGETK